MCLAFTVVLDAVEVDEQVQRISQDQQQDERRHQTHQDGRRQEGGAVAHWRKPAGCHVEGLDLTRGAKGIIFSQ